MVGTPSIFVKRTVVKMECPLRQRDIMPKEETIAIDLDGTLAYYDTWKGIDHIGDPLSGAVEFVQGLIDDGYDVCIYTTRTNPDVNRGTVEDLSERILNWLEEHGFPSEVSISPFKPLAMYYIDDRAYHHPTNATWTYKRMLDFYNKLAKRT